MNKEITFDSCVAFIKRKLLSSNKVYLYNYKTRKCIKIYNNDFSQLVSIYFELDDNKIEVHGANRIEHGLDNDFYEYELSHIFTIDNLKVLDRLVLDIEDYNRIQSKNYLLSIME